MTEYSGEGQDTYFEYKQSSDNGYGHEHREPRSKICRMPYIWEVVLIKISPVDPIQDKDNQKEPKSEIESQSH